MLRMSDVALVHWQMSRLILLLAAVAAPALSQTVPEPQPTRAFVVSVDLPGAYAGNLEAYAVLTAEEDDGHEWTLYMPYHHRSHIPLPGQRCSFEIGPGLAKDLVGREAWSKGRVVTFVLKAKCDNQG